MPQPLSSSEHLPRRLSLAVNLTETTNPRQRMALIALSLIVLFTIFHYGTATHHLSFHNVYRRLYYLPILIAAFSGGLRGGLAAAGLVCAMYAPHAFFLAHRDPSPTIDKLLEMILFIAVGALAGLLVGQRDRAQARVEATLRERDALAQQLVRAGKLSALGEVAAGLAHELRNPLASIMGSAEALSSEFPKDHRKSRIVQLMLKEIERLDRVISRFLAFARPTTPNRWVVDLGGILSAVRDLVAHRNPQISIKLPSPQEAIVFADPDQVTQVLLNLLLNAFEAIESAEPKEPREPKEASAEASAKASGEVEVLIEARAVASRRYLCVGVKDTGPGIAPAHLEVIFNPYFTTKPEGTGLGLSLSNQMMEAHGGFLQVAPCTPANTVWACFPISAGADGATGSA
jgi:two-component system, NtrC family, sensor histidine kinase HydH